MRSRSLAGTLLGSRAAPKEPQRRPSRVETGRAKRRMASARSRVLGRRVTRRQGDHRSDHPATAAWRQASATWRLPVRGRSPVARRRDPPRSRHTRVLGRRLAHLRRCRHLGSGRRHLGIGRRQRGSARRHLGAGRRRRGPGRWGDGPQCRGEHVDRGLAAEVTHRRDGLFGIEAVVLGAAVGQTPAAGRLRPGRVTGTQVVALRVHVVGETVEEHLGLGVHERQRRTRRRWTARSRTGALDRTRERPHHARTRRGRGQRGRVSHSAGR